MKLIFSPYFDNDVYLSRMCIMGEKAVGKIGLLEELELRTGTVGKSESESIRTAHYLNAMKQVDSAGRFYEKSFAVDPLGVAAELLRWRDSLVLAGWDSSITGISQKLDDLAEIENNFHCAGIADRWRNILRILSKKETRLPADLEIEVRMKENLLEPYLNDILRAVSAKGNRVRYQEMNDSEPPDKLIEQGKVKIIPFKDVYEATEWTGWHIEDFDAVITKDNFLLNEYLSSEGKVEIASEARTCNSEILQLFKLIYNCLKEPKDIRDIIAFLSLKKNPISGKIRDRLSYQLTRDGGFSEECMKVIEDFRNDDSIKESEKERSLYFIGLLTESKNKEKISTTVLAECNERLFSWINGSIAVLDGEKDGMNTTLPQRQKTELEERKESEKKELQTLGEFFKAMQILIEGAERDITYPELENWVKFIYKPQNLVIHKAEEGSVDTICDVRSIAEPVERVLWNNCTGTDETLYAYTFLSKSEMEKLSEIHIHVPSKDTCTQAHNYALQSGLSKITELTLTVPVFGNGEKLLEHPLITEIQKKNGMKENPPFLPVTEVERFTEKGKHVEKPKKRHYYHLDKIKTDLIKREYESYSSLEDLIQYPFEYVLKYYADIKEKDNLKDLNSAKGTAAHKYIELLFNKAKTACVDKPENITTIARALNIEDEQTSGHPMAEMAIQEVGLILEKEENRISKTSFLEQLYRSVDALTDILHKNHLEFIGSEMEKRTVPLSEVNTLQDKEDLMNTMKSRIDFVCKDARGNIYIIDLKWSKEKRYTEILQNSQDLQLAYYKKAVELPGEGLTGNVAAYGYFLLTCGTLLIPEEYNGLLYGERIKFIKRKDSSITANEIIGQAFRAYLFRMKQLQEGTVEEAEGMELEQLDYPENCFPIRQDFNSNKNKSYGYGRPNKIIKGDLK